MSSLAAAAKREGSRLSAPAAAMLVVAAPKNRRRPWSTGSDVFIAFSQLEIDVTRVVSIEIAAWEINYRLSPIAAWHCVTCTFCECDGVSAALLSHCPDLLLRR